VKKPDSTKLTRAYSPSEIVSTNFICGLLKCGRKNDQLTKSIVYLASPYTHRDVNLRVRRAVAACQAAAEIMIKRPNVSVFSPIAHTHPIGAWVPETQNTHAFWMEQDEAFLCRAAELIVLKLDGWEASKGVQQEIAYAKEHDIPISYMEWRKL